MKKFQVVVLILGLVMVLVSQSRILKAGKPVDSNPHPDGVFDDDQSRFKIIGDAGMSRSVDTYISFSPNTLYDHGVNGVSNTIFISNGGGDYVQNLGGSNAQRKLVL